MMMTMMMMTWMCAADAIQRWKSLRLAADQSDSFISAKFGKFAIFPLFAVVANACLHFIIEYPKSSNKYYLPNNANRFR